MCVASGGDLTLVPRYSNHSSADMYVNEITNKTRDDVKFGPAFVFLQRGGDMFTGAARLAAGSNQIQYHGTRLRVVNDLTFSSGPSMTGVNEDTNFWSAPTRELGHVLRDIIRLS